MNNVQLSIQFFLQLAVILLFCRAIGVVAARLGQPQVVAEMIAGVMLGPSLLGWLWPEAQQALFPWDPMQKIRDTQSYLFPVSQLGLALYMFIVGLEFRLDIIKRNLRSSIVVSLAGMVVPFTLGATLAWFLYGRTDGSIFPSEVSLVSAMIFLGASMCITAFPMLARIIHFKGLAGTIMGTVAIGAGAIDDTIAWCLLAIVLAAIDNDWSHALHSISSGIGFAAVVLVFFKPLLARMERHLVRHESLTEVGLVVGLACLLVGAWFTESIHLHAVFGAFVMGSVMPRRTMGRDLINRIQPLTVVLLLPLFFTYSGLNTKIGLINTPYLWLVCGAILVVAILGKGVACYLAARFTGVSNREAMGIGTLMNARGLMELIVINIGLQKGVITKELFAALVIMAVVTTLMASPVFELVMGGRRPTLDPKT
jgi:Kef-type K+ transport system membrane component KefB